MPERPTPAELDAWQADAQRALEVEEQTTIHTMTDDDCAALLRHEENMQPANTLRLLAYLRELDATIADCQARFRVISDARNEWHVMPPERQELEAGFTIERLGDMAQEYAMWLYRIDTRAKGDVTPG